MSGVTVINSSIEKKFRSFVKNGRILLFAAPCGFGKTTLAASLLKQMHARVLEVRADEADFSALDSKKDWDVLYIEELHLLRSGEDYQNLCALIRNNPKKRFIFTSRGAVSGDLISFRISGLLVEITENEMFFDKQSVNRFFESCGIRLAETVLNSVLDVTLGYPLAVEMFAEKMANGAEYTQRLANEILHDIFQYFDEMVFCRFDLPVRRFLLELAPFERFDMELAKMVSGDPDAGKILAGLQKHSRMLRSDGVDCYYFWSVFSDFLMWEQSLHYTAEQQRALCSRGGLYFELHKDYARALEFYTKSGEQNKVSELIIKITGQHPGMGHYEELEKYFLALPDEAIVQSPALMQGKCMLCALRADYAGSERWYETLKNFADVRKRSDAAAADAKSRLIWLDIALPQRGTSGMIDTIKKAFYLITNKDIRLMPLSVTSTLPSIMNGGKDFSDWSRQDDLLYTTMKIPVEAALGRDGVGLADCAIAESKFEKGENISARMLSLISELNEIQSKGTPDIEFALVGLLVRSQIDIGRANDAKHTLESLRERFLGSGHRRFTDNIDAFLCRIALRTNDADYIDEWYRDKAPRDSLRVSIMRRYRYITEAMAELSFDDIDAALLTLSPLEPYFDRCARHIDMIHLKTLSAIARYRKDDILWKDDIQAAVSIAEKYGFVRTIGEYGAAVLPLLEETFSDNPGKFRQRVIKAARGQAVYYPDFLKPRSSSVEKLTDAELQVLHLLCADKSNSEIGDILDIRLATVKSHVSHILQKLGASRRSEAKTIAEKLHII